MGIFKFVSKQEGFQTGLTEKFEQEVLFFKEKLLFWRKTCYNIFADKNCGELAQLGERMVRNHEVRGSIPLFSTKCLEITRFQGFSFLNDRRERVALLLWC